LGLPVHCCSEAHQQRRAFRSHHAAWNRRHHKPRGYQPCYWSRCQSRSWLAYEITPRPGRYVLPGSRQKYSGNRQAMRRGPMPKYGIGNQRKQLPYRKMSTIQLVHLDEGGKTAAPSPIRRDRFSRLAHTLSGAISGQPSVGQVSLVRRSSSIHRRLLCARRRNPVSRSSPSPANSAAHRVALRPSDDRLSPGLVALG
jgi:hypothetical protein